MILIPEPIFDEISEHARSAFPEECCGILVGVKRPRKEGDEDSVLHCVVKTENVTKSLRRQRYEMDPIEVFRVEKALRGTDETLLGFYHSHINTAPIPSGVDVELAWPGYVYLIATSGVVPPDLRTWLFSEERARFVEVPWRKIRDYESLVDTKARSAAEPQPTSSLDIALTLNPSPAHAGEGPGVRAGP